MKNTCILIITFLRDDRLFQCVKSIRKYYPDIAIYIGDNGESSKEKIQFCLDHNCIYHKLSFDSGVSVSRNAVLHQSPEKYIVICDDDITFTEHTKLEMWRSLLETEPGIRLVGGMLKTDDITDQHYEADIQIKDGGYHIKKINNPDWLQTKCLNWYFTCDLVLNFFMMQRCVWKTTLWDAQFKSAFEHSDFFLRLKYQTQNCNPVFDNNGNPKLRKKHWQIAYLPRVWAYHNRMNQDKRYKKYRKRTIGWILFADKWKVNTLFSSYNPNGAAINFRERGF